MERIYRELSDRDREIDGVIGFIKQSEENVESTMFDYAVRVDIKAAVVLMIYNEIESVVTEILTLLHETVLNGQYRYSQLSLSIKGIIENYYFHIHKKSNDNSFYTELVNYIEVFTDRIDVELPYAQMTKWVQLYSGNLDSKEINRVMKLYGIRSAFGKSELQTIKRMRNQLAHGEFSFEEIGRTVTYQQLFAMKEKTKLFLEETIKNVEDYLGNNEYLNRP